MNDRLEQGGTQRMGDGTTVTGATGLWLNPRKDLGNTARADIDGDGLAEVIVETEDGYVRILKSIDA